MVHEHLSLRHNREGVASKLGIGSAGRVDVWVLKKCEFGGGMLAVLHSRPPAVDPVYQNLPCYRNIFLC